MGPQIGGYITPGQLLLSDPDVRANTGNGDTWSELVHRQRSSFRAGWRVGAVLRRLI